MESRYFVNLGKQRGQIRFPLGFINDKRIHDAFGLSNDVINTNIDCVKIRSIANYLRETKLSIRVQVHVDGNHFCENFTTQSKYYIPYCISFLIFEPYNTSMFEN